MIKKILKGLQSKLTRAEKPSPALSDTPRAERRVVPREQHNISREHISDGALKVLHTLNKSGYAAFLVGGSVRDLLLGLRPKDFDIATDATPEELTHLFRNAMIIGRRFRIVHIRFGRETIEVTTFRGHHHNQPQDSSFDSAQEARSKNKTHSKNTAQRNKSGMLLRDNVYGTVEEDAIRRDFTVNALYYNTENFAVDDYVRGLDDIAKRQIQIIGNAEQRYREDPVRMLRAIRLAAKLDFSIETRTAERIAPLKMLLTSVAPARLFDEVLKLFTAGYAELTFTRLQQYELFGVLFPKTDNALIDHEPYQRFIHLAMENTDSRVHEDKGISPSFLFATLLWPAFMEEMNRLLAQKNPPAHFQAQHIAADDVIGQLVERITLPRRFSAPMKEIWQLQFRLSNRAGSRAEKLFTHPRFRAAYDFVLLREDSGENLHELGQWWTDYQEADETVRRNMADNIAAVNTSPRRRRNRKPR